jgi:hypothetical protein
LVESDETDSDNTQNNITEVHMAPTLKKMEPEDLEGE